MSFAEFIMTAFQGVGEAAVGNAVERLERKAKRDPEQEELRASAARHSAPSVPRWPRYSDDMIPDFIRHVHDGVTNVMVIRSATERRTLFKVACGRECWHYREILINEYDLLEAGSPQHAIVDAVQDMKRTCYCVQRPKEES